MSWMNVKCILNLFAWKFEDVRPGEIWEIFNFLSAKRDFNTQIAKYLFISIPTMIYDIFKGFSSEVRKCIFVKYCSTVSFSLSYVKYRKWYIASPFRLAIHNIQFHKKYHGETNYNILYIFSAGDVSWRWDLW